MSKISTIYDQLRSQIGLLFPSKVELPNPYSLIDNTELYLKDSWGLTVGSGSNSVINYLKEDTEAREFTVFLTKELRRLDTDVTIIAAKTKELLEEFRDLKNDLLDFDQIGIYQTVQKIDFIAGSGLQFVQINNFSFIYCTITFNIEYSETI